MHVVLISGSHRANSESGRVADFLAGRLQEGYAATTDVIKLDGNPLPLWDETAWDPKSELAQQFAPFAERLHRADALVLVVPEWAGMAAPALKNFMLYTHESMVGHKPVLLVAVSAGRGGSYPIAEMRASSYKNNKMLYLPEHLIVQGVAGVLKGDAPAHKDDEYIRARADFALNALALYAEAVKPIRLGGTLFDARYPFGM